MNFQDASGSNSNIGDAATGSSAARNAEGTLRLIANLPAPDGLEDRVLAGLRSAPPSGRVLNWPGQGWLRSAAAAAIVLSVLGGGWGIYSRVQPGNAVAAPPHVGTEAGFSNAGAVRVPQTVVPPAVAPPAKVQPPNANSAKKVHSKIGSSANHGEKAAAVSNATARPSVTSAR